MKTQQLKILAQQTTPWPWKWFTSNSHNRLSSVPGGKDGDVISAFKAADGAACVSISHDDMAFIESAHPGAVLELIKRLEAAERERDELRTLTAQDGRVIANLNEVTNGLYGRIHKAEAELARRDAAAGEPVGYYRLSEDGVSYYLSHPIIKHDENVTPLYTAAQPAVLPDEITIEDAYEETHRTGWDKEYAYFAGAKYMRDQFLTLGAQQQKVVAWHNYQWRETPKGWTWWLSESFAPKKKSGDGWKSIAVYLSEEPPAGAVGLPSLDAANVKWEVKK